MPPWPPHRRGDHARGAREEVRPAMTREDPAPRFERYRLSSGAHLSVHPTKKLKTVVVQADLAAALDASVTRRALLPMVLRRGTRRHPDMKAIHRRLEDLYGTSLGNDASKVGEWHLIRFRLEAVNDRVVPDGGEHVFREALGFLREMIDEPKLIAGAFDPEYVVGEKHNLRRTIESLVDDKIHYSIERCVREMCAGEEYRRYELGEVQDLPEIDAPGLTAYWRGWGSRSPLALYVAGRP